MASRKLSLIRKLIAVVVLALFFAAILVAYTFYNKIFTPNVDLHAQGETSLFIPSGSNFEGLLNMLNEQKILKNTTSFQWVAKKMKFGPTVRPGHYLISNGLNNKELISMLRSGRQAPVKVTFNKKRTKESFSGLISKQLELDSTSLLRLLNDAEYLAKYDLNPETSLANFIPNTYEFYWNTNSEKFFEKMKKEWDKFWTNRMDKVDKLGLSPVEIQIIASIVEEETEYKAERPRVAGVYLNRLERNMMLQADPTIKFALQRFDLKRVLNKHLEEASISPYSTYAHTGLPPGPICIASVNSIESVLEAEEHNYIYMCAKSDFSGAHAFATNLSQHLRNAAMYQAALNRRNIY